MQRIDRNGSGATARRELQELAEIREIADAPICIRAQRIQLGRETPKLARFQLGRNVRNRRYRDYGSSALAGAHAIVARLEWIEPDNVAVCRAGAHCSRLGLEAPAHGSVEPAFESGGLAGAHDIDGLENLTLVTESFQATRRVGITGNLVTHPLQERLQRSI